MPSEYIMYLSILLVGTLAIGGISVTMVAINNSMEVRAIEVNLENIMQNIAEVIHSLKEEAEEEIQLGATEIEKKYILTLPDKIYDEEYIIQVISSNITYSLRARLKDINNDISVLVSLLISPNTIAMSGTIDSTNFAPTISYYYDGVTSSIVLE